MNPQLSTFDSNALPLNYLVVIAAFDLSSISRSNTYLDVLNAGNYWVRVTHADSIRSNHGHQQGLIQGLVVISHLCLHTSSIEEPLEFQNIENNEKYGFLDTVIGQYCSYVTILE